MTGLPISLTICWAGDSDDCMYGLSALDVIILLALAGGAITGVMRGFVQEVLSLGALIVALFALRILHQPATEWLTPTIGTETGASVLAFALIMGVIWGGGKFAAVQIGSRTRSSLIGPVDRLLGGGFGLLKALLIASALFMLVNLAYDVVFSASAERPEWMSKSRTYPLMRATSAILSDVAAERIRDRADPPPTAPLPDAPGG